MEIGLTNRDIEKLLGYRPSIMMYKSLEKFVDKPQKFFNILKKKKAIFILYPTTSIYDGHWCVIIQNRFGYEFFDSYGLDMDNEKLFINPINLINNDSFFNILKLIFINTPYTYNKYKLQKMEDGINTCGRWCVNRVQNIFLSNPNYIKKVLIDSRSFNNKDKWIVRETS